MTYLLPTLRSKVIVRANRCCEYCLLPDSVSFYPHEVDHVIALKHEGETVLNNLAYACLRCNRYKGSDLASFDPETREFFFLFNPRQQSWTEHFKLEVNEILGNTPEGRTTAKLLKLNTQDRIQERNRL